ncbi:hypothetical protein RISW2_00160 [Roseivivax isoporae LMG 25204]|uniref:Uncharacterized protein n=1 Tax=Roseivivax isoporae LMG 25204 TaxID=1449351 RepID=X7FE61_9RHOB|nr:hypothetical protein RISW2_00160 [Roseivivax isoporae LMG 25204]
MPTESLFGDIAGCALDPARAAHAETQGPNHA